MILNGRFLGQKVTGVQRYARELHGRLTEHFRIETPTGSAAGWRGHLWEQTVLPLRCKGEFLWSPCNMGPITYAEQAVTVHDMATVDHPEWFDRQFALWYGAMLPAVTRRSRLVITVSEYSRERLLDRLGLPPEKVVAIHNGVDCRFKPAMAETIGGVRTTFGIHGEYVICVGSLEPRKNLKRLFAAWTLVQNRWRDLTLVVVGDKGTAFQGLGFENVPSHTVFTGYVSESDLVALYSGACAFVYPSLYEGFGLPILEAMACGLPVITSNCSGCAEVANHAALLVDPNQVEAIAEALDRLMADTALSESLRRKGSIRAAMYTWERSAAETLAALNQATA